MPVTQHNIKKGDRVKSLNFGWMEAVTDAYPSGLSDGCCKVDVVFDNTKNVRKGVIERYFVGGYVRDGSVNVDKTVGAIYNTVEYGPAEIVKYVRTKDVQVCFLNTGNIQQVQLDPLVTGIISDQLLIEWNAFVDKERVHINSLRAVLAKSQREKIEKEKTLLREAKAIESARKQQEFENERRLRMEEAHSKRYEKLDNISNILKIVDKELNQEKNTKGVLNFDFKDREGNWVLRFKMGEEFIQTRLGKMHNNMTQRVRKDNHEQGHYKSYAAVDISDMFKDPQKFCEWAIAQKGWGLGYTLDKDLLSTDKKVYSEENCVFLPREINIAIIAGKNPKIQYSEVDKYHLCGNLGGEEILVVGFKTEEEALEAYCKYRESYVKKLATEYKEEISERAYAALMNWKANLQD
jgi:hypothetical protein